jgi:agmatinase
MPTPFDPNAAASSNSGIFGLPFTPEESALVLLPVPWEATTSYGGGTSRGPEAILAASRQVDLFHHHVTRPYEPGIAMLPEPPEIAGWNAEARELALQIISADETAGLDAETHHAALARVNELSAALNTCVRDAVARQLDAGKIIGLLGGDHSTPFGAYEAIAARVPSFDILQIDAHCDLRDAFEGFTFSHASIMRNALERIPAIRRLVQVGIRDYCEEERQFIESYPERVATCFDADLADSKFGGLGWSRIADDIVASLGNDVWISFDIDGLAPHLCPHTGTPVPGGLEFNEATHLIRRLATSGRRIIGFDLNEVSPGPDGDEWDANVGARMLYNLAAWTLASQGRCKVS